MLGCVSQKQLWSQVPSLPIEFNGTNDHSYLTMLLGNAPLGSFVLRVIYLNWVGKLLCLCFHKTFLFEICLFTFFLANNFQMTSLTYMCFLSNVYTDVKLNICISANVMCHMKSCTCCHVTAVKLVHSTEIYMHPDRLDIHS